MSDFQENLQKLTDFKTELEELINKHSMENSSDTPDFILAQYLRGCLVNFGIAMRARDKWYGINQEESRVISREENSI